MYGRRAELLRILLELRRDTSVSDTVASRVRVFAGQITARSCVARRRVSSRAPFVTQHWCAARKLASTPGRAALVAHTMQCTMGIAEACAVRPVPQAALPQGLSLRCLEEHLARGIA